MIFWNFCCLNFLPSVVLSSVAKKYKIVRMTKKYLCCIHVEAFFLSLFNLVHENHGMFTQHVLHILKNDNHVLRIAMVNVIEMWVNAIRECNGFFIEINLFVHLNEANLTFEYVLWFHYKWYRSVTITNCKRTKLLSLTILSVNPVCWWASVKSNELSPESYSDSTW